MEDKNKDDGLNPTRSLISGGVLLLLGIFLVFQNTRVTSSWHIWRIGLFDLPSGIVVLPVLIGIGLWVYKPKRVVGKIVVAAGLLFILLTIVLSVRVVFLPTGLFNYILMFGCVAAGLALLLRGWLGGRKQKTD